MEPIDRVELMLQAIESVKRRAIEEAKTGDIIKYRIAMEDLLALECSLVYETTQLVNYIKKIA